MAEAEDDNNNNDNRSLCEQIKYNRENNNVIINFNTKQYNNRSIEEPKGRLNINNKGTQAQTKAKDKVKSSHNSKQNKSIQSNENQIESKSVQFSYNPRDKASSKNEIKENSIVKTEHGYEIYFVENSASNIEDLTVKEDINTQELISQNFGLKEAMKNNEDTYNSLEKEFMFNNNINAYSNNSHNNNNNNINGDNNNQLLLNFTDNDNDNYNGNNYCNISQNQFLNENSPLQFNINKESSNINNHIIINFNNCNYQFSALDEDNSNIKRYNSNNLSLEDLSLYSRQNSKLIKKKIFQNNPVCNLSNRIVNDENNILNKSHLANSVTNNGLNYKFIDNVKQNAYANRMNKIKAMIPLSQFLLLKKHIMLIIIHFAYDDIEEMKNSYESIKNKINATLSHYYYPIVEKFNRTYSNDLELHEYFFCTNRKRSAETMSLVSSAIFNRKFQPKTRYVSLDLYIKAKIVSSQINQTYAISLLFNDLKAKIHSFARDQMILTWKYVLVKLNDINVWMASEAEDYDGRISRFSYIQPIVSYTRGDFVSIKLPILFKDNSVDPTSISWVPIEKVAYSPEKSNCLFFEKSVYHNTHASLMKQYDKIRFCELETLIHLWKNEKSLTNRRIVDELRKMLRIGDVFNELSFEFDIRRVYIFKVKLKAIRSGFVKRNKYFNYDIVVKEANSPVSNEAQCLGLLNCINTQYEMRIGEVFVFYFTEIGG